MQTCPLCKASQIDNFYEDKKRQYLQCNTCYLVFVPSDYHLDSKAEKAEYDLHQNSPDDLGYRKFLGRIFEPINDQLQPNSDGLDFGCGPGPTLSVMFEEAGHNMTIYDKFYATDKSVFEQTYDFITATEVVEHLTDPSTELNRLWNCLKPGGTLGIMTKLVIDKDAFANWHYKNDMTHICFFSQKTFNWLAETWQAKLTFPAKDVIILKKKQYV